MLFDSDYLYNKKLLLILVDDDKMNLIIESHHKKYLVNQDLEEEEITDAAIIDEIMGNYSYFTPNDKKLELLPEQNKYFIVSNIQVYNSIIISNNYQKIKDLINKDYNELVLGKTFGKITPIIEAVRNITCEEALAIFDTTIQELYEKTDIVNKFLFNTNIDSGYGFIRRPAMLLKDGTTLSVQASHAHYCSPRTNKAVKYEAVEVGFPSKKFKELLEYAEDPDSPCDTVYPYVPVQILNKIINEIGLDPNFENDYINRYDNREKESCR